MESEEILKVSRELIGSVYPIAEQCQNEKCWYTCYKCGKCGRVFENGIMVDDGGTTVSEEEE